MTPKFKIFIPLLLCGVLGLGAGCEREAYVVRNPALLIAGTDLLDFGEIPVDYTATRSLQLANAGQQTLEIQELIAESLGDAFSATSIEDGILGGDSIEIEVSFTPTAELLYEGTLTIKSNTSTDTDVTVALRGSGLAEVICGDCDNPPEDECADENTLLTYTRNGECVEGVCRYVGDQILCPHGCLDGACLPPPDQDGDGILDAVAWTDSEVFLLRGASGGGVSWGGGISFEDTVVAVSVSDLNGDALSDLAIGVTSDVDSIVAIFHGELAHWLFYHCSAAVWCTLVAVAGANCSCSDYHRHCRSAGAIN